MELVFRVLVAAVLVVAPSALFLGLWHGLHALRDDALIEQMKAQSGGSFDGPQVAATDVLPTGSVSVEHPESFVTCGTCGAPNTDDVRFCHECLSHVVR